MDIQTLDPTMVVIGVVVLIVLFWILKKGLMLVIYLVAALVRGARSEMSIRVAIRILNITVNVGSKVVGN